MLYTVKEVSALSNVTVKTLHHYHKIGLLQPCRISDAGYRLYGEAELERLQQILFYRELDFPLEQIKRLLEKEPERLAILSGQERLLKRRIERLDTIMQTLGKSIASLKEGEPMAPMDMFKGFASEEEWTDALQEQNRHLKQSYGVDILEGVQIDVQEMNEQAAEVVAFMEGMAGALRAGIKHNDDKVRRLISSHLDFLNERGHAVSAADFAAQTGFFLSDDFHLRMLEGQQTGLAYYVAAAAHSFAADASR
ncbi:MerR family transcriptional regulator [Gordoniibacillus kamchatkensis]|uniref:MerR family transcriptional regulator n=1 Tax=Gordoniibacillus kamchatkensis TaxID=1590651 RepID=A0ABR5AFB3_9BACL|nr:MerR family transcriptional regulator [Paenibacillus sp. VKM B-2647]KIL39666.1 MerR family transcriptional regulator [Paenibacillus sp. VKM B-2647]